MGIKIFSKGSDITDINTKFMRTYAKGFPPPDDIEEQYILEYIPDDPNETDVSVTVTFPHASSAIDGHTILFYDEFGNLLDNQSVLFEEATTYPFSVKMHRGSIVPLINRVGLNTYNRELKVERRVAGIVDPTTPTILYITRLYKNGNVTDEVYSQEIFNNVIPSNPLFIDGPITMELLLGVNIYNYNSQTGVFGTKLPNLDNYDYYIKLENQQNINWDIFYVNDPSGEVSPEYNVSVPFTYGPIPSTKQILLVGIINNTDFRASTIIKHYAVVEGLQSSIQTVYVDITNPRDITSPNGPVATTTTLPCNQVGEECFIFNEETGENTCCEPYSCDIDLVGQFPFTCV